MGKESGAQSDWSVSLSADGSIVAIGAHGESNLSGSFRAYEMITTKSNDGNWRSDQWSRSR